MDIESACENNIFLEFQIENLLRALRSAQNAENVVIRLTKKNKIPLLSLVISSYVNIYTSLPQPIYFNQIRAGRPIMITQDIPIRILTPMQMSHVKEPSLPSADVYILLPQINSLRSVAERMKTINDYINISANNNGELVLTSTSDLVDIQTFYKGLTNPNSLIFENHAIVFTVFISSTSIGTVFQDQDNASGAMTYYIPARLN
ncbi:Checkpoint protein hus1 [Smittium culicis]|uniref:Checkpoint protein hus1 n=1 Tax=Smittium culicis TaxID=133412 RepID=A0A1R1WY90_9FUNG|nr:Checkpoint protein hus1 [Smittium culicis]OMJ15898.1 Checkpoint protein hus1 [Smittium culicis]